MTRSHVLILGLLAAAVSASAPAPAQDRYPARPVRLVIPSVPAGVHDVIGRRLGREGQAAVSAPSSSTTAAAAAA